MHTVDRTYKLWILYCVRHIANHWDFKQVIGIIYIVISQTESSVTYNIQETQYLLYIRLQVTEANGVRLG
jgi:hypothetical protein